MEIVFFFNKTDEKWQQPVKINKWKTLAYFFPAISKKWHTGQRFLDQYETQKNDTNKNWTPPQLFLLHMDKTAYKRNRKKQNFFIFPEKSQELNNFYSTIRENKMQHNSYM